MPTPLPPAGGTEPRCEWLTRHRLGTVSAGSARTAFYREPAVRKHASSASRPAVLPTSFPQFPGIFPPRNHQVEPRENLGARNDMTQMGHGARRKLDRPQGCANRARRRTSIVLDRVDLPQRGNSWLITSPCRRSWKRGARQAASAGVRREERTRGGGRRFELVEGFP